MTYKIGSLNVFHFSMNDDKKRDDRRAAKHFANIIKKNKFDLVAFQEFDTKTALNVLLQELGGEYAGVHATDLIELLKTSPWKPNKEYAFVWLRRRISLVHDSKFYTGIYEKISRSWEPYFNMRIKQMVDDPDSIDDETKNEISLNYIPSYKDTKETKNAFSDAQKKELKKLAKQWIRPPLVCAFRPTGIWKLLNWELRIINTHIHCGNTILPRVKELEFLKGELHTIINTMRFGDFRSVYSLILGDYNLTTEQIQKYLISEDYLQKCENHVMTTVQKENSSLKKFNEKNANLEDKQCYSENYDHFSYDTKRVNSIAHDAKRIDFKDFKTYRTEISDHVPVSIDIKL